MKQHYGKSAITQKKMDQGMYGRTYKKDGYESKGMGAGVKGNTDPSYKTRTDVYSGAHDNSVFKKELQFGCNYGRDHQSHVRKEWKKF